MNTNPLGQLDVIRNYARWLQLSVVTRQNVPPPPVHRYGSEIEGHETLNKTVELIADLEVMCEALRVVLEKLRQLTTIGIPCIYYGSEQSFDGSGGNGLPGHGADQWIRECMFGGKFGAFRSQNKHFFIEGGLYHEIARVAGLRREHLALTRGRQYLREISTDGKGFGYPFKIGQARMKGVIAWSRIFNNVEIVCAINTDVDEERKTWVTVDEEIHDDGHVLTAIYEAPTKTSTGASVTVETKVGRAVVQIAVPPAGFVMFTK